MEYTQNVDLMGEFKLCGSDIFNVKFLYTWMDRIDSDRRLCGFVRNSVHSV